MTATNFNSSGAFETDVHSELTVQAPTGGQAAALLFLEQNSYATYFGTQDGVLVHGGGTDKPGKFKIWSEKNFPAPTVLIDLADAQRRLDTGGQPITYYGAKRWNYGDPIVDSAQAVRNAIDAGPNPDFAYVNVPKGDFRIESQIYNTKNIKIQGMSRDHSRFVSRADGLVVFAMNTIDDPNAGTYNMVPFSRTFSCKDIGFAVDALGPRTAIDFRGDSQSKNFEMENVKFSSFNGAYNWRDCFVRLQGVVSGTARRVTGLGNSFNPESNTHNGEVTPIGFHLLSTDNNHFFYGMTFDECQIDANLHAIFCEISGLPGNSGSIEGIILAGTFLRSNYGAAFRQYVPRSAGVWRAPLYVFCKGTNTEGPGSSIQMDSATDVYINQCWFVQSNNYDGVRRNILYFYFIDDLDISQTKIISGDHATLDAFLTLHSGIPDSLGVSTGCIGAKIDGLKINAGAGTDYNCGTAIGSIPDLRFTPVRFAAWDNSKTKYAGTSPNLP